MKRLRGLLFAAAALTCLATAINGQQNQDLLVPFNDLLPPLVDTAAASTTESDGGISSGSLNAKTNGNSAIKVETTKSPKLNVAATTTTTTSSLLLKPTKKSYYQQQTQHIKQDLHLIDADVLVKHDYHEQEEHLQHLHDEHEALQDKLTQQRQKDTHQTQTKKNVPQLALEPLLPPLLLEPLLPPLTTEVENKTPQQATLIKAKENKVQPQSLNLQQSQVQQPIVGAKGIASEQQKVKQQSAINPPPVPLLSLEPLLPPPPAAETEDNRQQEQELKTLKAPQIIQQPNLQKPLQQTQKQENIIGQQTNFIQTRSQPQYTTATLPTQRTTTTTSSPQTRRPVVTTSQPITLAKASEIPSPPKTFVQQRVNPQQINQQLESKQQFQYGQQPQSLQQIIPQKQDRQTQQIQQPKQQQKNIYQQQQPREQSYQQLKQQKIQQVPQQQHRFQQPQQQQQQNQQQYQTIQQTISTNPSRQQTQQSSIFQQQRNLQRQFNNHQQFPQKHSSSNFVPSGDSEQYRNYFQQTTHRPPKGALPTLTPFPRHLKVITL